MSTLNDYFDRAYVASTQQAVMKKRLAFCDLYDAMLLTFSSFSGSPHSTLAGQADLSLRSLGSSKYMETL
jgi:hypothetical protein